MKRKYLLTGLIGLMLGVETLMAGNSQLAALATTHVKLSKKILQTYSHKENKSTMALLKKLESGQKKLRHEVHNREISNLLQYLSLCVTDMKKVVAQPYSRKNSHIVSDLSASLAEGSRYIASSL